MEQAVGTFWWCGNAPYEAYGEWKSLGQFATPVPRQADDPGSLAPWDWVEVYRRAGTPDAYQRARGILRFLHHFEVGDAIVVQVGTALAVGRLLEERCRVEGGWAVRGIDWQHELDREWVARIARRWPDLPRFTRLEPADAAQLAVLAPPLATCTAKQDGRGHHYSLEPRRQPDFPILHQSPWAERILRDFRWREYLHANPDVAQPEMTPELAKRHFIHQGYYERRIFDPDRLRAFDGGFYRARYPELGLASDAAAQVHYCYQGYYEGRIPNRDTEWLYDATLHIFQMGKVGSHAIAALCKEHYAGKVLHLHWATDIPLSYPSCHLPYSQLLVHPRPEPVKVISASRELVSWVLSSVLQWHGPSAPSMAALVDVIEHEFWTRCQHGATWFDHQYFCGLDVMRHPFDTAAGWSRIRHEGIDLLVYRQEDLAGLGDVLADFIGVPRTPLKAHNVGEAKRGSAMYMQVYRDFKVPGNALARLYETPFMRTFYSDDERERFFDRWVIKPRRRPSAGFRDRVARLTP